MKIKGAYDSGTSYSVGDVVRDTDGTIYVMFSAAAAGTDPKDTRYWNRVPQPAADAAGFAIDVMDSLGAAIPKNIDDEAITLKTDDGEYLITVDDSGDTPELAVTAIEDEEEADG